MRDEPQREDPQTCRHYRVDNKTWQCVACGTRMLAQCSETETVQSAPNLAAGTGAYVPDRARHRVVPIGIRVTYECDRCGYDGDAFETEREPIWDCGKVHRGDYVPASSTR